MGLHMVCGYRELKWGVCNAHSRLASLGLVYELNSHARASSLVIRARHT